MTYNVGDPGHVKAHGDLVSSINVELARFGLTGALPIKDEGAEGHLDDHNAIRAKLDELATLAGQSFSTPLPPVRQLGDGSHTDDHNTLAACASEVATWPAWNAASGGIEQSIGNYNGTGQRWMVHTFTGNGTLTVTRNAQPFRVLVVGGGGGGRVDLGGGGGAGGFIEQLSVVLPREAVPVVVGNGGVEAGDGQNGGNSSIASLTAIGGGGGMNPGKNGGSGSGTHSTNPSEVGRGTPGQGNDGGHGYSSGGITSSSGGGGGAAAAGAAGTPGKGGDGGAGHASDITGTHKHYAGGGGGGAWGSGIGAGGIGGGGRGGTDNGPLRGADGTPNTGGGGGGGAQASGGGGTGGSGVVIVAYRIS